MPEKSSRIAKNLAKDSLGLIAKGTVVVILDCKYGPDTPYEPDLADQCIHDDVTYNVVGHDVLTTQYIILYLTRKVG